MRSCILFTAATVMTSSRLFEAWIERPGPIPEAWQLPDGQFSPQFPAAKKQATPAATTSRTFRCTGWSMLLTS